VRQFTYTAYLPGIKKTVCIKELQFGRYKHLIKAITNDNSDVISSFFNCLLSELCIDDVTHCSFLDKIILLLTIRSICIAPDLELTATCPKTQSTFNYTVQLFDIIDRLQALNLPSDLYSTLKRYNNDNLLIELGMPSLLNIKQTDLDIIQTAIRKITLNNKDVTNLKNDIIDNLPIIVLKDIKDYLLYFSNTLKEINLLSIQSPFSNDTIDVPLNLFTNSIIEFLKICFKRNPMTIYEMEYFLNSKLNLDYDLIKTSTPAELNIYINLFKDERAREENAQKGTKTLNPLQP
jgi:hypothetical protein